MWPSIFSDTHVCRCLTTSCCMLEYDVSIEWPSFLRPCCKNIKKISWHKWFSVWNTHKIMWAASRQNQQNGLCARRRLRSAWESTQSDQSLRCPHEESLGPYLPIERTAKTDQTGRMSRLTSSLAHMPFFGFVVRWLMQTWSGRMDHLRWMSSYHYVTWSTKHQDMIQDARSNYNLTLCKLRHEKTCLQGFRPGKTLTGLLH